MSRHTSRSRGAMSHWSCHTFLSSGTMWHDTISVPRYYDSFFLVGFTNLSKDFFVLCALRLRHVVVCWKDDFEYGLSVIILKTAFWETWFLSIFIFNCVFLFIYSFVFLHIINYTTRKTNFSVMIFCSHLLCDQGVQLLHQLSNHGCNLEPPECLEDASKRGFFTV